MTYEPDGAGPMNMTLTTHLLDWTVPHGKADRRSVRISLGSCLVRLYLFPRPIVFIENLVVTSTRLHCFRSLSV